MWVQHPSYSLLMWSQNRLVLGSGLSCYWVATNTYETLRGQQAMEGMIIVVPWNPTGDDNKLREKAQEFWQGGINWRTAMTYKATKAIIDILRKNPDDKVLLEEVHQLPLFQRQEGLSISLLRVQKSRSDKETGYTFKNVQ